VGYPNQPRRFVNSTGRRASKDAKLAGIFNMGGAAVANYVSVLERLR
jgi:acetyl-CoA C-acetyltransferase